MRRRWCDELGVDAERLVTVRQVHGDDVIRVRAEDSGRGATPSSAPIAAGDAMVTADSGVVLMTLHADCLPILLCDPGIPAVAVVHAGWRGTVAGIAGTTVRAMGDLIGAEPKRLIAYLGPANRACCYEVGDDVADQWRCVDGAGEAAALGPCGSKWRFDVAAANRWALLAAGLSPSNIEVSAICTQCEEERWFSHRAQGATTGRFGAVIGLRG
jgi:YfiH family protein